MTANLHKMTNDFILNEGYNPPSINSYIQALEETLNSMSASSLRDNRRLEVAKENLRNIKRHARRRTMELEELRTKVTTLEEKSNKKRR